MALRDYLPLFLILVIPASMYLFLYLIIWTASIGYWEIAPIILIVLLMVGSKGGRGRHGLFS